MVELCRPLAYHTDPNLPSHTFRYVQQLRPLADHGHRCCCEETARPDRTSGRNRWLQPLSRKLPDDRTGDPARIEPHTSDVKTKKKKDVVDGALEGIVYKVNKEKVVIAVDGSKEVDLPERVRL